MTQHNASKIKIRLDYRIAQLHPTLTRSFIQSLIMQNKVTVNGIGVTKAGTLVRSDDSIFLDTTVPKYVSRAGFKLEKALDFFGISVEGLTILDAGISTGGFTDCLLQRGALAVYGVDVGYGQVHEKIKNNTHVTLFEKTNLRYFEHENHFFDLITLDLSFISLLKVCERVYALLKDHGILIALIKPQFEADKKTVDRCHGVISDDTVRTAIVQSVITGLESKGFIFRGMTESPITGAAGNKEFLAYFSRQ